jgi:tetrahydromethanopterin S-methyltransferase subunit C
MGITKPSKGIFFISLIIGVFAILNQWVIKLTIPILSDVANIVLLAVAFVLLVLGVIFKKL